MKKFFMFLAVMGVMAFSAQNAAAQDEAAETTATEVAAPAADDVLDGPEEVPMHQALKTKFIEGGASVSLKPTPKSSLQMLRKLSQRVELRLLKMYAATPADL